MHKAVISKALINCLMNMTIYALYLYFFHFMVKSYVHWCPTELVL